MALKHVLYDSTKYFEAPPKPVVIDVSAIMSLLYQGKNNNSALPKLHLGKKVQEYKQITGDSTSASQNGLFSFLSCIYLLNHLFFLKVFFPHYVVLHLGAPSFPFS